MIAIGNVQGSGGAMRDDCNYQAQQIQHAKLELNMQDVMYVGVAHSNSSRHYMLAV